MTCIIGMIGKSNDKVIIGSDSIEGNRLGKINIAENNKIKKIYKYNIIIDSKN